jgi:Protein of unknown function (DUF2971)
VTDQPPVSSPPPILFHYTTLAGACGIATSKRLWASSIRHLSDSTEFTYAHDVLREALEEATRGQPAEISATVEYLLRDLDVSAIQSVLNFSGALGATYVLSLSAEPDKLSQWRAYSPGGGYALGFRTAALLAIARHQGFNLIQCSYDRTGHLLDAQAIASTILSRIQQLPPMVLQTAHGSSAIPGKDLLVQQHIYPIRREMLSDIQRKAPAWKHPAFHEEAEWRLVSLHPRTDVKFRVGRTSIVPYVEIKLNEPEETQVNGLTAVLANSFVGPCPEPELAVGTLSHLFEVQKISCPQYTISPTPYRQW